MKTLACFLVLSLGLAAAELEDAAYGPELSAELVTGSRGCTAVDIAGDYLYAAGNDSLAVFDISVDPTHPKLIAELTSIRGSRQLAVTKKTAYITARNHGIWIVDITNPRQPKLIRHFDTIELATGIAATENVLFIAHRVYGIQILDVTDPRFPQHISQVRTAEAQSVAYQDGMLFVGDWAVGKLTVVDVHDLRQPKILGQGTLDGFGDGVFVSGNLCVCSTGHDAKSGPLASRPGNGRGVELFDITDPRKPRQLGRFKFPCFLPRNNDFWTPRACGNTLFCVDSHNGFYMVDATDRTQMRGIGHLRLPPPVYRWKIPHDRKLANDCCASLATGDGVVYIAGQTTGLHVVKTPLATKPLETATRLTIPPKHSPPPDPRLQRYDLNSQVRRVTVKDDFVYVAASHGGLKLFKIVGNTLQEQRTWDRACVHDVSVHGDTLFSAENACELAVYKIATDGALAEVGRSSLEGNQTIQIIHPFLGGTYLAVSGGTGRFTIVDASNLTQPKPVYSGGVGGILYGDMFPEQDLRGVFPINWHSRGIAWYDISGKAPKETLVGGPPKGSQLDGLALLRDNRFVFPVAGKQLALLDASVPDKPEIISVDGLDDEFPIRGIPTVDKNIVVFASRRDGKVVAIDMSQERPVVIKERCYNLSDGNCDRIAFHQGRMVIPAGNLGLVLEKH